MGGDLLVLGAQLGRRVVDADMDAGTIEDAEIWINARDIISIVEEV